MGVLNLRMTPSSTLINREENTLQSREEAEGMFPQVFSVWCVCVAGAKSNRMLIKTHSKLGPVSNEYSLLFATEISFQHLICLQIP